MWMSTATVCWMPVKKYWAYDSDADGNLDWDNDTDAAA